MLAFLMSSSENLEKFFSYCDRFVLVTDFAFVLDSVSATSGREIVLTGCTADRFGWS